MNGYRLLTEAEWEYAARGGIHNTDNYIYSGSNIIDDVAWYDSNSGNVTHPVRTKLPNQLGIFDMSGNIWEWCWDRWYGTYYQNCYDLGTVTNPTGVTYDGTPRSIRSGIWVSQDYRCQVDWRASGWPEQEYFEYGFRVARSSVSK